MKVIYNNSTVNECPKEEELHIIRHTAAHIMAQAIKRLFPHAVLAYGPATEKGFYYDVDLGETKLSDDDLRTIEAEMRKIVKENIAIKPFILSREEAIALMKSQGEKYKEKHIDDLPEDAVISFYKQGEYVDMCVGPHLCYTKALKAFKITGQSGAYWKNDKNNKMLTRIKGIAFSSQKELEDYLKLLEEAEKRDHRRIGKEMGLFMFSDEASGFPFFLPKGMALKNTLIDYWREIHIRENYVEVSTLIIMNRKLWETSGHWKHYKSNMYSTVIDEKGKKQRPIMLHRVCFGSIERFIGIITEHFAGKFPVWLAPMQAKVLLVLEKSADYGNEVYTALHKAKIRCEMDSRNEKIGYMIREAQLVDRVSYMVIIGQKEVEDGTVSIRSRDTAKTETMTLDDFICKISNEIENRI